MNADHDPDNWTWKAQRSRPGACVLVDVDGVIANGWHRQHFLQNGRRDWKGFFAAADGDAPIAGSQQLLSSFDSQLCVVLLTARPDSLYETTLAWLAEHDYRWDVLIMRGRKDGHIASPEFKRRSIGELRDRGFLPQLGMDDDQRNIDMLNEEGIAALYVHSGYYEA